MWHSGDSEIRVQIPAVQSRYIPFTALPIHILRANFIVRRHISQFIIFYCRLEYEERERREERKEKNGGQGKGRRGGGKS